MPCGRGACRHVSALELLLLRLLTDAVSPSLMQAGDCLAAERSRAEDEATVATEGGRVATSAPHGNAGEEDSAKGMDDSEAAGGTDGTDGAALAAAEPDGAAARGRGRG